CTSSTSDARSRAALRRRSSATRRSSRPTSAGSFSVGEALLELADVTARYGPVRALHGVSLTVEEGEIAAVLGANGAGKTTTLRAVSGTVRRDGTVRYAGRSLGH